MGFKEDYVGHSVEKLREHFHDGAVAHLGIDLVKGYFDPTIPLKRSTFDENDFFQRSGKIIGSVENFSVDLRRAGIRNVWVRHVMPLTENNFKSGFSGLGMIERFAKLSQFTNQAHEFSVPVDAGRDLTVDKSGSSAFYRTTLEQKLHDAEIEATLITGGMRHVCPTATAIDSVQLGFQTFMVDDLLIDSNPLSEETDIAFWQEQEARKIYCVRSCDVLSLLPRP